jgi:hypothetical protein
MAIPKYVFLFFVVIFKQSQVRKSLFALNTFSISRFQSTYYLLLTCIYFSTQEINSGYPDSSSPNFSMSCLE